MQRAETYLEPYQTSMMEILKSANYFHESAQSFMFDRVVNASLTLNFLKLSKRSENLMISPGNK